MCRRMSGDGKHTRAGVAHLSRVFNGRSSLDQDVVVSEQKESAQLRTHRLRERTTREFLDLDLELRPWLLVRAQGSARGALPRARAVDEVGLWEYWKRLVRLKYKEDSSPAAPCASAALNVPLRHERAVIEMW